MGGHVLLINKIFLGTLRIRNVLRIVREIVESVNRGRRGGPFRRPRPPSKLAGRVRRQAAKPKRENPFPRYNRIGIIFMVFLDFLPNRV